MDNKFGLNATYVEILRAQWQKDPTSVSDEWKQYFSGQPAVVSATPIPKNDFPKNPSALTESPLREAELVPLLGVAKKIVDNMEASLEIPTATSLRDIPVKVLEENRSIINDYLVDAAYPRCSFTHLIAYAIVRAIQKNPSMNNGFKRQGDQANKLIRSDINLGLAIDLPARDGGRTLMVPNIKRCQDLDFWAFFQAYNDTIERARKGKLTQADFDGTTVTLTNPGGIGTVASIPRLMPGQGTIVAAGRIAYPAQYEATSPETLQTLGVGKVMNVTSTYDHRVIQGAESGRFLADLHALLIGEDGFYNDVFKALKIPHYPYQLASDQAVVLGVDADVAHADRAMRVSQLIHAYRVRGYLLANVDPLDLQPRHHPELELANYGLTLWDLDREYDTLGVLEKKKAPLRDILRRLRWAYSRRIGIEYMHIADVEQKKWIQNRIEKDPVPYSRDTKIHVLDKLLQAEGFEHFLHKRFVGHKRFSIEGAESAIAMLDDLLRSAASHSVAEVSIGMAHRGRLNVLANIVGKPYEAIFAEFDDIDPKTFQGSGDVKYHMGARGTFSWRGTLADAGVVDERTVQVDLACNPSHLEAVDSVVEGQVRAKQDMRGDRERKKIVPVLIHGDAAFSCQGIVYETLQLSGLQGYRTGGTVHLIIDNQIGYTTPPERGRSSINCSDIGRAIDMPILRVNGDAPEACIYAMQFAFEYRMRFGRDVIIDMVCYRRHGHNEGDEPSFTQPILYKAIQEHPSAATIYADLLLRRKEITFEEVESLVNKHHTIYDNALDAVRKRGRDAVAGNYMLYSDETPPAQPEVDTRIPMDTLRLIAERTTFEPKTIEIHPRVRTTVLDRRRAMVLEGKPKIDFGMAEILAYGSLLLEGVPVRLSGQDTGRGTFAHRHAVLYDINDGRAYMPLNHLRKSRDEGEEEWAISRFRCYDSPLSEEAVLGFEYGYAVTHPTSLVIWEAQFGDFFNGAQIQIDQFIASAETKWNQKSRLTMFLPHGYDGQGPEHSSSRIERFLQLSAENNMRVVICSTPAQLFHLLRRQAKTVKKPLIVFSHKSLLRAEEAGSTVDELANGAFYPVLDDPRRGSLKAVKRLVLCSGKLYWDLDRARVELGDKANHVAVVRIEELYPFPADKVAEILAQTKVKDIVWVQEEPQNNGAFWYMARKMASLGVQLRYIGRAESASPATGSPKAHKRQQKGIIDAAFAPVGNAKQTEQDVVVL